MGQQVAFHHVGEYLAQLLAERGLTTAQVAEKTGFSPNILACLVAGRRVLTADVAFALGDLFELSPLVLLEVQRRCCLEARDREALSPATRPKTLAA